MISVPTFYTSFSTHMLPQFSVAHTLQHFQYTYMLQHAEPARGKFPQKARGTAQLRLHAAGTAEQQQHQQQPCGSQQGDGS